MNYRLTSPVTPPSERSPVVTGADLPPLGWQHPTPYDPGQFNPVSCGHFKPTGGLWTTRLHGTWTTWTRFAWRNKVRDHTTPVTTIIPDPDAVVWCIDNYDDFAGLLRLFPLHEHPDELHERYRQLVRRAMTRTGEDDLDWAAIAKRIDAVWLTDAGMHLTRHREPGLLMWDMETVFFLNPRLTAGDVVEPHGYEPKRLTPEQIRHDLEKFVAGEELALTEAQIAEMVDIVDGLGLEQ